MSWTNADTRLCRSFDHTYGKRFIKIARDDPESLFEVSEDPWCVSCYANYKEICLGVSKIFKISTDSNKTWRLADLEEKIDVLLGKCSKLINMEIVNLLYPILEQICVCLRSKLNHNDHCYRPKPHILYQGNIVGDFEHDVYDMCNELYRIYNTYTLSLRTYNSMMKKDNQLTNLIEKNYPNLLNKCRSKNRTFQKSMTFNDRYLKNENKDGKLIF
jgi:hypothetical protein